MFGRATITLGIGPHSSLFIYLSWETKPIRGESRLIAEYSLQYKNVDCIFYEGLLAQAYCC